MRHSILVSKNGPIRFLIHTSKITRSFKLRPSLKSSGAVRKAIFYLCLCFFASNNASAIESPLHWGGHTQPDAVYSDAGSACVGDYGLTRQRPRFWRTEPIPEYSGRRASCYWYGQHDDNEISFGSVILHGDACGPGEEYSSESTSCNPDYSAGPPQACIGNPINIISGEKYQRENDYVDSLTGTLSFSRFYNSKNGVGTWSYSFGRSLLNYDYENQTTHIALRDNGSVIRFIGRSSTYTADAGYEQHSLSPILSNEVITGWRLSLNNGRTIETYDVNGRILEIENQAGVTHTVSYEEIESNQYRVVTNHTGEQLTIIKNADNQLVSIETPMGLFHYTHTNDQLTSIQFPDLTQKLYHYENATFPSLLTGITQRNGTRFATWGYDQQGRAISSEHGIGLERVELDYSFMDDQADPRIITTNALGKDTIYHYMNHGFEKLVTHVEGVASSQCLASNSYYTYDEFGNRRTQTDERGYVTETIRDAFGRVTEMRSALTWSGEIGESTLVESDASQRVTTIWNADSPNKSSEHFYQKDETDTWSETKQIQWAWDANGRLQSRTALDPHDATTVQTWAYTYTYHDSEQQVIATQTVDGPRTDLSDTTVRRYSANGVLTRVVNALGHATEYRLHTALGAPQEIVDTNGLVTELQYDINGRLASTTLRSNNPLYWDRTTQFEYNLQGLLSEIISDDGTRLIYFYDLGNRLQAIENEAGERIEFTLDGAGNITQQSILDASRSVVFQQNRAFDELSRLKKITQHHGQETEFNYDVAGNNESAVDGKGQATSNVFDGLNQVIANIDPLLNSTEIERNSEGQITSIEDARRVKTEYTFNGLGQLTQLSSPDTGVQTFSYDSAGNRVQKTDSRGVLVQYNYDALNRVTEILYPASPEENVQYFYDVTSQNNAGIGKLSSVSDESGSVSYTYDSMGQLATRVTVIDSQSYSNNYTYDNLGRLRSIAYPSGREVIYVYDARSRLAEMYTQPGGGVPATIVAQNIQYLPF